MKHDLSRKLQVSEFSGYRQTSATKLLMYPAFYNRRSANKLQQHRNGEKSTTDCQTDCTKIRFAESPPSDVQLNSTQRHLWITLLQPLMCPGPSFIFWSCKFSPPPPFSSIFRCRSTKLTMQYCTNKRNWFGFYNV